MLNSHYSIMRLQSVPRRPTLGMVGRMAAAGHHA